MGKNYNRKENKSRPRKPTHKEPEFKKVTSWAAFDNMINRFFQKYETNKAKEMLLL